MSSWRAEDSLEQFLKRGKTVAIAEIDTRRLTRILRDKGAQAGCIVTGARANPDEAVRAARKFPGLKGMDLARLVSDEAALSVEPGQHLARASERLHEARRGLPRGRVRLRDQAQHLAPDRRSGLPAHSRARTTPADEVMSLLPDGVFLSNGPGDPEPCDYAIEAIGKIVDSGVPTFGICLGHQLLGLASGAKTVKMKFGHHGANHPVVRRSTPGA